MLSLDIRIAHQPRGRAIVTLRGPLDAHTVKFLEKALGDLVPAKAKWVVLDLSELEYISSSGALLLVNKSREAQESGGKAVFVKPKGTLMSIFALLGLDDIMSFAATVKKALAALK